MAQYSALKQDDDDDEEEEEGGEADGGGEDGDDAGQPNPRKMFYKAVDRIWADLAASGDHHTNAHDCQKMMFSLYFVFEW